MLDVQITWHLPMIVLTDIKLHARISKPLRFGQQPIMAITVISTLPARIAHPVCRMNVQLIGSATEHLALRYHILKNSYNLIRLACAG